MRQRKAFTLLEVLAVVAIISILMTILLPSLTQTHERAKRTACATNLHGIIQAMYLYAQNPPFLFPAIMPDFDAPTSNMYLFYPEHRTNVPSTTGIPSPTVDLWALVRPGLTVPKQFICPSTVDLPDAAADSTAYYDFPGIRSLSYGYQYQHSPNRAKLGLSSEPTFPVMADGNPYIKGGLSPDSISLDRLSRGRGNSLNHLNREGQNILFVDGHVNFESGPDVGLSGNHQVQVTFSRGRDNCYTYHASTLNAPVDYGLSGPTWTLPSSPGTCTLGGKSDACLVP
jgi:prepilin-type N-terminal cleavage/methylation domain-containing protein/prepilin-type processing-associated H-X9-DG protein